MLHNENEHCSQDKLSCQALFLIVNKGGSNAFSSKAMPGCWEISLSAVLGD